MRGIMDIIIDIVWSNGDEKRIYITNATNGELSVIKSQQENLGGSQLINFNYEDTSYNMNHIRSIKYRVQNENN
jgi:hypothetical protein